MQILSSSYSGQQTLGTYHPNPILWQWRWVGRNSLLLENPMSDSLRIVARSPLLEDSSQSSKSVKRKFRQECKANIPHQLKNNDCILSS